MPPNPVSLASGHLVGQVVVGVRHRHRLGAEPERSLRLLDLLPDGSLVGAVAG